MSKALIHLVDDDSLRGLLTRLLASDGYDVRLYPSGDALVAAAQRLEAGIILLDVNLPGANGYAVHKALRAQGIDFPVVMMTGAGDQTLLAWQAGVSGFIPKPFGRSEILAVLDQVASEQAAEEQFVVTAA